MLAQQIVKSVKAFTKRRAISFRDALEIASFLTVIAGVPLFFYQQSDAKEDWRVVNTLQYASRFQESEFLKIQFRLLDPWLNYQDELRMARRIGGVTSDVADDWVRSIVSVDHEIGEGSLRLSVFEVTDFLDQLALCVEEKICSADVAKTYFEEYSRQFYCLYGVIIRDHRQNLSMPRYGARLERFMGGEQSCISRDRSGAPGSSEPSRGAIR